MLSSARARDERAFRTATLRIALPLNPVSPACREAFTVIR